MNCPNCRGILKNKEVIKKPYSLCINECTKCGGWWFNGNNLEEYRASVLTTSEYSVLPEFELIPAQTPAQCAYCSQDTFMFYNVGAHVVRRCAGCSGIFLSKGQILTMVKTEADTTKQEILDAGLWAIILAYIVGN